MERTTRRLPVMGDGLRAARHKKGLSLEQISSLTKIAVRYLEAIENGEFGKLPGGVYNVSYIRQYAEAIDYDESELIALYRSMLPEPPFAPAKKKQWWQRLPIPLEDV